MALSWARVGSLVASGILILFAPDASGYCQTSLCQKDKSGIVCSPAQADDCGIPMRWPGGCFGYAIAERASKQLPYELLSKAMNAAATTWGAADCGNGEKPGLAIVDFGPVACDQKEYNLKSGNANIVIVHDDAWPYDGAGNTLALTTVTFDLASGSIFDADLELNGTVALTAGDADVTFDVESIVTHEVGHMLGLAHSEDKDATMYIAYQPGEISLRTLSPDDEEGVCKSYAPADVSACDPTPRRGLAGECDPLPIEEPGCACSTTQPARLRFNGLLSLGLLGCALGRRARRR